MSRNYFKIKIDLDSGEGDIHGTDKFHASSFQWKHDVLHDLIGSLHEELSHVLEDPSKSTVRSHRKANVISLDDRRI